VLDVQDVTVRFGGKAALNDTSITVEPGKVTGLIGPNGAGKTTLFNVVTGLLSPNSGRVVLDGKDVTGAAPHRRARLGLARTFQRLELFTSLTVRDNVRVASDIRRRWAARAAKAAKTAAKTVAGSGDETRDEADRVHEPAAGQTDAETAAFGGLLRRLAGDGMAVCLVEHDMTLVMDVCETIHVLDYGRTIAAGTPDDIRNDPAVVDAYLGTPEGVG
jgi:branched-chain amino acid transport system ATP-binding protein